MRESREFWDKSARRYAKSPIKDVETYHKKLALTQEYFQPDWHILEFGCGTGGTAIEHSPYVAQVVATDLSSQMIDIAKDKAHKLAIDNISFQVGGIEELNLDDAQFDAVLGLNVLHLVTNVDDVLTKVYRLLRVNGMFVCSIALVKEFNYCLRLLIRLMQFLGLAPHVNLLDRNSFTDMLVKHGFSIEQEWRAGQGQDFIIAKKQAPTLPTDDR